MGELFNTITANKFNVMPYLKYILVIPIILHLSSIKLITNNKGNKKMRKSKSKTKLLNSAKIFIFITTILFGIIAVFGFKLDIEFIKPIMDKLEFMPSYATPLLLLVSIIEVMLASIVYQSY
jgi:predicted MFS family arabinose efflux permease